MKINFTTLSSLISIISLICSCSLRAKETEEDFFVQSKKLLELQDRTDSWMMNTREGRDDFKNLAKHLKKDPDKILTWIHDNIGISLYKGALRGPVGTIIARRANGIDQTILMGMLLHQSGYKVRFIRGEIDSLSLAKHSQKINDLAVIPVPKKIDTLAREKAMKLVSDKTGIPVATILKAQKASEHESRGRLTSLLSEISEQTEALITMMEGQWDDNVTNKSAISMLSDHLWLEYESEGQWITADPLLSALGKTTITELKPKKISVHGFSELPDDLFHTIEIMINADVRNLKTNEVSSKVLTKSLIKTINYRDDTIGIHFSPNAGKEFDLKKLEQALKNADSSIKGTSKLKTLYHEIAESVDTWTPIIEIGDKAVAEFSIDKYGNTHKSLSGLPIPISDLKLDKKLKSATSALSNLGQKKVIPKQEGSLERVFLTIITKSPDRDEHTHTRDLFNLKEHQTSNDKDKQLIRTLGLSSLSEYYIQTGIIYDGYYTAQLAKIHKNLLHQSEKFSKIKNDDYKATAKILTSLSAHKFQHLRQLAFERGFLAQQMNLNIDIAEPQLFSGAIGLRLADKLQAFEYIDIIENKVQSSDPKSSLTLGVVDTVLEWQIIADRTDNDVLNTASVFSKDLNNFTEWKIVKSKDELLHFPESTKTAILSQKDKGYAVFISKSNKLPVWYAIHKQTGQTLGFALTGLGYSVMTEYLIITVHQVAMAYFAIYMMAVTANGCFDAIDKHGASSCEALYACVGGAVITATGMRLFKNAGNVFTMFGEAVMNITWEVSAYGFGNEMVKSCERGRNRR